MYRQERCLGYGIISTLDIESRGQELGLGLEFRLTRGRSDLDP